MAPVDLSVVIVNWNGRDQIGPCLDSIPPAAADRRYEVVVVDNASTDCSVEFLRDQHPNVRVVESQANLGYARGAQAGIDIAAGEYVAVVNPDIVLGPGALDHVVRTLEQHPQAAWAGPKIVQPSGFIQSGPFRLCSILEPLETAPLIHHVYHPSRKVEHDRPQCCERLSGACMVLRASMLRRIGGMPSETFLFGEEILLGARCRDHGYEVWYDPLATALHEHGASTKQLWGEEDITVATRVGHLAALRVSVSRARFAAYCLVLLAVQLWKLLLGLLGRPFPPRVTWRHMKIVASALFRMPTMPAGTVGGS